MEKKFFLAAVAWTGVGLASGLYYREMTKFNGFDTIANFTQLAVVHAHTLVLGTLFSLLALALERVFSFSSRGKAAAAFFPVWNIALALTVVMQLVKGSLQVLGNPMSAHAAIAGLSGLGHIGLSIGFVLLLVALNRCLKASPAQELVA